ncbi:hypothetical protein JQ615_01115 [Bradyrhizobium jicamae]|uniref:Uncharacterized protein n=1 Tax=Bradyrhizobium jicamae TaxID=280332 RepID=A0ABS5FC98_9BRAD|nr:hypothetical protein [Bradyrhizobium jicamae]MBR0793981.1 hypothetical protein [Bradyrhizobium jicamae]
MSMKLIRGAEAIAEYRECSTAAIYHQFARNQLPGAFRDAGRITLDVEVHEKALRARAEASAAKAEAAKTAAV